MAPLSPPPSPPAAPAPPPLELRPCQAAPVVPAPGWSWLVMAMPTPAPTPPPQAEDVSLEEGPLELVAPVPFGATAAAGPVTGAPKKAVRKRAALAAGPPARTYGGAPQVTKGRQAAASAGAAGELAKLRPRGPAPEAPGARRPVRASRRAPRPPRQSTRTGRCEECGKYCRRLDKHLMMHKKIKPHSCVVCGHSFTQSEHLKRHLQTHEETKDDRRHHPCPLCDKVLSRKDKLKEHLAHTHSPEREAARRLELENARVATNFIIV